MTSAAPTVLVVCSANICRSVLAEALMQNHLPRGIALIRSAGTPGIAGANMCPAAREYLLRREPSAADIAEQHRSRQLAALDATGASLILTASRRERDSVVKLAPAVRERTFTMREAVALTRVVSMTGVSPTAFDVVVERLTQARGLGLPLPSVMGRRPYRTSPDWRDIPDAHVGKQVHHRHTLKAVAAAAEELAAFFAAAVDNTRIATSRSGRHLFRQNETTPVGRPQHSTPGGRR